MNSSSAFKSQTWHIAQKWTGTSPNASCSCWSRTIRSGLGILKSSIACESCVNDVEVDEKRRNIKVDEKRRKMSRLMRREDRG